MAKGEKTGGRQKGTPNKVPTLLKDAILRAADLAGKEYDPKSTDGLVSYLTRQASENPAPFIALMGKVLPLQVVGDKDNPVVVSVVQRRIVKPEGE